MITKQMLIESFAQGKFLQKQGREVKIVLTREEAKDRLRSTLSTFTFTVGDKDYFFYTDSYCAGNGITWGPNKICSISTVPSSTVIPHYVVERKGLEDGIVDSLEKYEFVYHKGDICIESLDEYLEILNQHLIKK